MGERDEGQEIAHATQRGSTGCLVRVDEQKDFEVAKRKIIGRMGPLRFVSLDDFQGQWLRPGELLSVIVHDLKQLLEQAVPDTQGTTRDQLLRHQFLTGLPTQVSNR